LPTETGELLKIIFCSADINEDGVLNVLDIVIIANQILGA